MYAGCPGFWASDPGDLLCLPGTHLREDSGLFSNQGFSIIQLFDFCEDCGAL